MTRVVRATVAVASLLAARAFAQAEPPTFRLTGILDGRLVRAESPLGSFTDLGKTRYGPGLGEDANLLRLSQALALVSARLGDALTVRVHLSLQTEPDRVRGETAGLTEAFVSYRPVLSPYLRLQARVGLFFPPISLENTGPGWTTQRTLTGSAINSWIGEEVRTLGVETSLAYEKGAHAVAATGAAFWGNDPAGSLLAWRGWTLQDRITRVSDRLPLAPIPAIQPSGPFSLQAPYVKPIREVDGRAGVYGGISYRGARRMEARALYYDNRADQTQFDGTQYAWRTTFLSMGLRLPIGRSLEVLTQSVSGLTRMGPGNPVSNRFSSAYGLVSGALGKSRLSLRFDRFRVEDRDGIGAIDDNTESGWAWTVAYTLSFGRSHRVTAELIRVGSDRPVREALGRPREARETLAQLSYRLELF